MGTLVKVSESRARLMRGFTHDVKNPLGAADGFLALLEDDVFGQLTAQQRGQLGGVITVQSALDVGSRFSLWSPSRRRSDEVVQ